MDFIDRSISADAYIGEGIKVVRSITALQAQPHAQVTAAVIFFNNDSECSFGDFNNTHSGISD
ncbi:MAG: hypothetical protein MUQ60_07295 [Porticoccaceae bacterium]|nr:hypothetical protein [Porticoccaceae bacterium]